MTVSKPTNFPETTRRSAAENRASTVVHKAIPRFGYIAVLWLNTAHLPGSTVRGFPERQPRTSRENVSFTTGKREKKRCSYLGHPTAGGAKTVTAAVQKDGEHRGGYERRCRISTTESAGKSRRERARENDRENRSGTGPEDGFHKTTRIFGRAIALIGAVAERE